MSTNRVVEALRTFSEDVDQPFRVEPGDVEDFVEGTRPMVVVREAWRRLKVDNQVGPRPSDPLDVEYEGEAICTIRADSPDEAEAVEDEIVSRQGRAFPGTPVDKYWFLDSSDATDFSESKRHVRKLGLQYSYSKQYEDP